MSIDIRPITASDVPGCAGVAFAAHQHVAALHHVPPEHPSLDFSMAMMTKKFQDRRSTGWVAEKNGEIVGSVFLNDFRPVAAIGPLTVHPAHEGGAGRALMEKALDRAKDDGIACVRLVQSPSHLRSLALYTKLGFEAREPLVLMQGTLAPAGNDIAEIRRAREEDVDACGQLAERVLGVTRLSEVRQSVADGTAMVVERGGTVRAYITGRGLLGHAVAIDNEDLVEVIARAPALPGPGFFAPIRNTAVVRWALGAGLRMAWPALLMTRGPYVVPRGGTLPSIAF